jgi:diguanylate cyclase (GGDEF)-like protein
MRLQRQLFDSRVARRIFSLFLLASLIPLSALALVLLRQVGSALEEQAFDQLDTAARSYGRMTMDRLLTTAALLARPELLASPGPTGSGVGVDAVVSIRDETQLTLLGDGTWSPPMASVAVHATLPSLTVVSAERGIDVVIAARGSSGTQFARLDQAYLAGIGDILGGGMEACIFAANTTPLHCSTPLSPAAIATLQQTRQRQSSGQFTWTSNDEEWLASYWQLFLPSRFVAEPWVIVVSQPRSAALASLAIFNSVVPQTILFTLALIVILAITQIRRTLNPLNELLAGTKRIAAQDFATPVTVANRDEFGTLAGALNGMSAQLEQQFGAFRALADIDRSILQTTAIEPVLVTLFDRLRVLVPGGRYAVLIVDTNNPNNGRLYGHDRQVNASVERIEVTPRLREWLAASPPDLVTDEQTLNSLGLPFKGHNPAGALQVTALMTGETVAGALVTACADGTSLAVHAQTSIRELAARVAVAIAAAKREAELIRRAHFDSLTTLPNRELLEDRMQQAVARAQREDRALAVLFIDLDGFKGVNDTLGHRSGDEVLKETALRLSAVVREADTVARLGGDEYAIVLPQVQGPIEAESVALNAIEALRRPFVVESREVYVSASIGLALFPDDGVTAGELLRKADMAMYNAKQAGKSCVRFFAEDMDRRLQERHSLHHDLHSALETEAFTLAYQPQIDIRTGQLVATEALLRWVHPRRGSVSPALFVPILEETGLIHEVGAWVLRKALADFVSWRRAGLPLQRMAVNVSARQLFNRRFIDNVTSALKEAGLQGSELEVELTEASLVQDFRGANEALTQLRSNGVRIALDDFGTGYSSLAYLNELVFDTLKIDRAFVVNLPADKSVAIVKAIIAVASALEKEVVAEGIESELQLGQLRHLGCQYGQGYLLGKPLSGADFVAWVETSKAARTTVEGASEPRLSSARR